MARRGGRWRLSAEREARIERVGELRAEGLTRRQVARLVGRSPRTVDRDSALHRRWEARRAKHDAWRAERDAEDERRRRLARERLRCACPDAETIRGAERAPELGGFIRTLERRCARHGVSITSYEQISAAEYLAEAPRRTADAR